MNTFLSLVILFFSASFMQHDKDKEFKESISIIASSLQKGDVVSVKMYYENAAYKSFNRMYKNKNQRVSASILLKGRITYSSSKEKTISGYGYQIHFVYKKDKWVIRLWDIFSSD